mmetsp:Transcript_98528/g.260136  ORF Transcript_98528/g.260136 Transcript_98528/m.260136 type:complete len:200 (+) Transcript_98528:503-1102(+)
MSRRLRPWARSSLASQSAAPSATRCTATTTTTTTAPAIATGFWRTSSARMSARWTSRPPSSRTCSASWPSSRSRSEIGNSPVGSRGFTRMRPTRLFRHHEPPFFGRRPSRVRAPLFVFGPSSWLPIARGQHRTRVETDFSLTACALAARVIRALHLGPFGTMRRSFSLGAQVGFVRQFSFLTHPLDYPSRKVSTEPAST